MYGILITIHAIIGILLIVVILVQSGRSGGLAETFGGAAESIFGTKTNAFMVRLTTVMAILFITSCLTLAYVSKQQSKSLMERVEIPETKSKADEITKQEEVSPPELKEVVAEGVAADNEILDAVGEPKE
ncbi:MAG: preprotein translocase subunit SecG [Candidatus Omnitrophica bacterium]|nr:preprotein translocase subunit SecG [Candidatus Omnitrophota bacterium]